MTTPKTRAQKKIEERTAPRPSKAARQKGDNDPSMPPFLRRGTPEHAALVRRAEKMAAEGRGMMLVTAEDRDVPIHALAAELGFKKHQYRVEWFRDEAWLKNQMEEKAKRDASDAEKKARRDAEKAKLKEERKLAGGGNRRREPKTARRREDLPQGRILWVGPNPKKEGSDAHARWEKLREYHGRTVEAYCFDGHNQTTLTNAVKQGKIKVLSDAEFTSTPAPEPKKEKKDGKQKGAAPERAAEKTTQQSDGRPDGESSPAPARAGRGGRAPARRDVAPAKKGGRGGGGQKSSDARRVSGRAVKKGQKK